MNRFIYKRAILLALASMLMLTSCKGMNLSADTDPAAPPALELTKSTASGDNTASENDTGSSEEEIVDAYAACGNYLEKNRSEYLSYQEKNPKLPIETVVTYVNIGLNVPFYTEVAEIANPDDLLVLCNKYHYLSKDYVPKDLKKLSASCAVSGRTVSLRADAAAAFEALSAAAKKEGYTILGQSGYRSYSYQDNLYRNYVATDGQKNADTYSARPGYSEHQTGLAIDVRNAQNTYTKFGTTAEYQWAKQNLHKYGFILRYLPEKQDITGYKTEEWHFRYVGKEVAAKMYELGITFDEYCAIYQIGQAQSVDAPAESASESK